MRLNKYLAHATGMSRRDADAAITAGRISINGIRAILGSQVTDDDVVRLDSREVRPTAAHTYVILNKPVGYLCSRRSQGGVPTIFDLLPEQYRPLKPVGRLDKDSSGILLLTNDGDFAHRMTHPSLHKVKVYDVELDKPLQPLHQQMISDYGIKLEDGVSRFLVEKLERGDANKRATRGGAAPTEAKSSDFDEDGADRAAGPAESDLRSASEAEAYDGSGHYRITMHEGRNRQIRRTFAALGYTVTALHRTTFGNYSLGDIKTGEHTLTDIR